MMKYITLFSLFLITMGMLAAQNYRIINPDRDYYYGDMNRVIHIDSVKVVNGDTLYHNYQSDSLCAFNVGIPLWLSQPILVDTLGNYHFHNLQGMPILLKSQTLPGTHWTVMTFSNGFFLQATHTQTNWDSIPWLGIWDSVKTITFKLRSSSGAFLPSPWNTIPMKLSKEGGLIRAFEFDHFPDRTQSYGLVGVSNPDLGKPGLDIDDFLDFSIGDQWQTLHYWTLNDYSSSTYRTHTILDKQELGDTVILQVERWIYSVEGFWHQPQDTSWNNHVYHWQFIRSNAKKLPLLARNYNISWYRDNTDFGGRAIQLTFPVDSLNSAFGCWDGEWDAYPKFCIVGLGCEYYNRSNADFYDERLPTYYSVNGEEWGNRYRFENFIPTNLDNNLTGNITLSPNPFSGNLQISFPENKAQQVRLELYDLRGKIQLTQMLFSASNQKINTATLPTGVYLYRISAANGSFSTGKLIKR